MSDLSLEKECPFCAQDVPEYDLCPEGRCRACCDEHCGKDAHED